MRLTFAFLGYFSLCSAVAAPPWIAHYFPVNVPGSPASLISQPLAIDESGNIFVSAVPAGSGQMCISKLNPRGEQQSQICFANPVGTGGAAAVDEQGNLIIAGTTNSPGSLQLVSPLISQTGSQAGYIMKFNSQLTQIVFATLLGGPPVVGIGANTTISALALDPSGNIYVSGWTDQANFPVSAGAYQTSLPATTIPLYVSAISAAGDKILWSTLFGGEKECTGPSCGNAGMAQVSAMAVDSGGAVTIAGSVVNEQIPVTSGVVGTCFCAASPTSPVAFLARLNSGGSHLSWATYINYASIQTMALDNSANVVIGGEAYMGFTTTSGALQATFPGSGTYAGFVAKIDASATHYLFATFLGSTFQEQNTRAGTGRSGVAGLALDATGTIWATGGSTTDLPLPASAPILGLSYIVGLNSDGSALTSAMTTPEGSTGSDIAIAAQGPVVWGPTGSILIPTPGAPASLAGTANSTGPTASGSLAPNEIVSFYGVGLGPSRGVSGHVLNGALTTSLGESKYSLMEPLRRCSMPGRIRSMRSCHLE